MIRLEQGEAEARFNQFRALYGCDDVRTSDDGTIMYRKWMPVRSTGMSVEEFFEGFQPLSKTRVSSEAGLRERQVYEVQYPEVRDDEGSVEAAIRSVDYILDWERNKASQQTGVVLERANYLLTFFQRHSPSSLSREERLELQDKTTRMLLEVNLDPDTVVLEENRRMSGWLIKGSLAEDSLALKEDPEIHRVNPLITTLALLAAQRRSIERSVGVGGYTIPYYLRIRESLAFGREFDIDRLSETEPHLGMIPETVYFREADRPADSGMTYTTQKIGSLGRRLLWTRVRPYRPVAVSVGNHLLEIESLLRAGERQAVLDLGYRQKLLEDREQIHAILNDPRYVSIYP